MIEAKRKALRWVVQNYDKWPVSVLDANSIADAEEVNCEWAMLYEISSLPVLCTMAGQFSPITSVDYFYGKRAI